MEILKSQPLSFWISFLAVCVSIVSLILTYRNSRHSKQLDSLQRRTQLLYKLTESKSKVLIVKLNLMYSKATLQSLNSNPVLKKAIADMPTLPIIREAITGLNDMGKRQSEMDKRAIELEEVIDRLRANCDTFDEKTDAKKIEKLLPQAQSLQVGADDISTIVTAITKSLENSLKTIESIENKTTT